MKKKLLLCVALVSIYTTVFSQGIEPAKGSGTPEDPYQIENFDNLLWVSVNTSAWNKHYIQTADIDATGSANLNNGAGFSPIGTYILNHPEMAFTGGYDGQGFAISNLTISRPDSADFQGLFGCICGGSVKDLKVLDAQISGNSYTGILAGDIFNNSFVVRCSTSGLINSTGENIGGLAGALSNTFVDSCFTTVTITATSTEAASQAMVGGFIGQVNSGTITGSGADADISAGDYKYVGAMIGSCGETIVKSSSVTGSLEGREGIGGFIGYGSYDTFDSCFTSASVLQTDNGFCGGFAGTLIGCEINHAYSVGDVTSLGTSDVGGFVGFTSSSNYRQSFSGSKVESSGTYTGGFIGEAQQGTTAGNCYATGEVHCTNDYAGGFIGLVNGSSGLDIFNCYSTGKVSGTGIKGGFAGYYLTGTITDCFWDVESSENTTAIGQNSGEVPQYLSGKNSSEMKDVITFTSLAGGELSKSWDFVGSFYDDESDEDIWDIDPEINNGYPYLTAVSPPDILTSVFPVYDLNKKNEIQLVAYPNPWVSSQDNLSLILKSDQFEPGNYTVSFIDIYGRICLQKALLIPGNSIHSGETHFSLPLINNPFKSGIYFIVLMKQSKIISRVKLFVHN